MIGNWEQVKELLSGLATPLVISAAGFAVRVIRFGSKSWRQLAASGITSMFVGVMAYWALDSVDLPPKVVAAIIGLASYMGGTLLDAAQAGTIKTIENGVDKIIDDN